MADSIQDLIARKNYPKALELIQTELSRRPKDPRLRLQRADVLVAAGRGREAVPVLMGLADEHAAEGFAAKAIAILKRIEKIDPGRRDVEDRLANLIQEKARHTPDVVRPSTPDFGFEEFDPSAEIPVAPPVDAGSSAAMELEGLEYVTSSEESEPAKPVLSTPLFEGFSQEELVAVMRGLNLIEFQPGDVLVTEGAPGDSLFILATGMVKAWVRDRKGSYMKVKELNEGDFFGEISLLTGKPRTATITAATSCEVLELPKKTLDSIAKTHPRVREVLKDFQQKRAQDTVEHIIRGKD